MASGHMSEHTLLLVHLTLKGIIVFHSHKFVFFQFFSGVDNYERMLTLVSSRFFSLFTCRGEGNEARGTFPECPETF